MSGSPAPKSHEPIRLAIVVLQLAALVAVVRIFELESRTAFQLLVLAAAGFVVHANLPHRFRLPFFALVSATSVVMVLGVAVGALALGAVTLIIGIAHAPIGFWWRVITIIAVALGCAALRVVTGPEGTTAALWAVVGAMLMFRLALYLHAVKHRSAPFSPSLSAAYFLMLPNAAFPLFPVVDYQTFARTHFDAERFHVYDRGLKLITRGIIQLLLYRLVAYNLTLGELHVNDLGGVLRHIVSTFLLYLKVSGQFHLICGVLHLYGFRLPETHHLYYLASSLTDFWRRINIYWKDFMQKLVYLPSFFYLRRFGNSFAIAAATLIVFGATWFLHAYQFYVIHGTRLFAMRDIAFWGVFGCLVLVATFRERRAQRGAVARTQRAWSARRGVATVSTFLLISLLWSLWNAESGPSWVHMLTQARYADARTLLIVGAMVAVAVFATGFGWGLPDLRTPPTTPEPLGAALRRGGLRLAGIATLGVVGVQQSATTQPLLVAQTLDQLHNRGEALVDAAIDNLGYYEALTRSHRDGPIVAWPRDEVPLVDHTPLQAAYQARSDFLFAQFRPSTKVEFQGYPFTLNNLGLRDRDYSIEKPDSTYRIALLGPSDVLGWGVADGEPMDALLEARLDSAVRPNGARAEVLNYGFMAYSLAQQVYSIEARVKDVDPDLVVLTVHPYDLLFIGRHLRRVTVAGIPVPDPELAAIVGQFTLDSAMSDPATRVHVRPHELAITTRLFTWASEITARMNARLVVVALRLPGSRGVGNLATSRRAAEAAGVEYLDCSRIWDDVDPRLYRQRPTDDHPNAAGQRMMADCLYSVLTARATDLGMPWSTPVR